MEMLKLQIFTDTKMDIFTNAKMQVFTNAKNGKFSQMLKMENFHEC